MHFFPPGQTFNELYDGCIDEKSTFGTLNARVRSSFVTLATKRRQLVEEQNIPSSRAHIDLLQRFKAVWAAFEGSITCFVCFAQTADRSLSCGHRLCDPCVVLSGSTIQADPWGYSVNECPLCKAENKNKTPLKPPTAGNRVLKLSGLNKKGLVKFLEDMRQMTACMAYHFRPYEFFDIVIGVDTGAFFGQTVFLEEWSIEDSHRSDSLSSPADVAVHFCNGNIAKAQPLIEGKKNPSDLIVEYDEGTSMRFLQSTASRMLASLFYIELASIPEFCSGLSLVHLRIRCRVPPGPSLIALLRLPLQNSQLYCWAETRDSRSSTSMKDGKQNKEPLAISTSVAQYQEGFSKAVTVEAKSLGSVIFVGITTKSGAEVKLTMEPDRDLETLESGIATLRISEKPLVQQNLPSPRLITPASASAFSDSCIAVSESWTALLRQTSLPDNIPSSDPRISAAFMAVNEAINSGSCFLSRLGWVELFCLIRLVENVSRNERRLDLVERAPGYGNASIAADLYMRIHNCPRRVAHERKRRAKRWSELAGPSPLLLLVFSAAANSVVSGAPSFECLNYDLQQNVQAAYLMLDSLKVFLKCLRWLGNIPQCGAGYPALWHGHFDRLMSMIALLHDGQKPPTSFIGLAVALSK
ncbi:hypothetical protein OOU_Y34scaffold00676g13 [Pyricularia oryzae Y34]|uniref:RING-type domain-containing protein n=2 Tax=Pyricularia oryzae TaxID=318829 RepID=A0AA97NTJ2_PYRO3|nr:hypothetical protein OOU_Y34scaffold00676g13 [Pyricularia oryzae Y34]